MNVKTFDRFNYKIEEANKMKAKNSSLTNKPINENKENINPKKRQNETVDANLEQIRHGLPEITITRKENIISS